jgi:hypothetical protein
VAPNSSSTTKPEPLLRDLPTGAKVQYEAFLQRSADLQKMALHVEDDVTAQSLKPALQRLETVFLKLLVNQEHLNSHFKLTSKPKLEERIQALQIAIADPDKSAASKLSRSTTLEMLEERVRNNDLIQVRLDEIESDLGRLEALLELALERAVLHSNLSGVSFHIDLASRTVTEADYFGAKSEAGQALEARLQKGS